MLKPAVLLKAATILSLMACAACGDARPTLVLPPAELASCADEPIAPDLPPPAQQRTRDLMVFDYILALRSAWGDCRAKVDGLATWRETAESGR